MSKTKLGLWAAMTLILAPLAGAQSYSITDLGVFPGGDTTQPTGLNNHGVVVGSANTSGAAAAHAFVWTSAGGLRDLGTLGNPADDSVAEAINNSDQVVGYSFLGNDAGARAFLWTSGAGMKSLGTLGGNNSSATGINDAGQVVGTSLIAPVRGSSATHPFLWTAAGGMQDLGTLGGTDATALAINNSGAVVGYSDVADGHTHAFLWTAAGGMQDLGTFGGDTSVAFAINDKNQVVGYADSVSGNTNAFIWNASRGMQNIGAGPGAAADGINDAGQVVGSEGVPGGAYVWTATQHAQLLVNLIPPDSGWTLSNGDGVNAVGQIVVTGLIGNEQHGGLLTPVS
jgi:probable HAF family extracellular repeat protein